MPCFDQLELDTVLLRLPPFCGFAINGGEGGIGFATQNLLKTTYGVPSPLRSVKPNGSHLILLPALLLLRLKWRRRRDWFCYAKSFQDHLWCPISASLRRTQWFASHPSYRPFAASP
jgi:hypothetical protein